ncbi:hypothetical protein NLG97_g3535 [Lecanicillium saksenae]|uniref:Uncharacterized protein n=1 Tax=Lecanicillium saksenae TaxID=468837 RepID=A0ACC1QZQ0_9HYPO|nr:hypothetical protein NLG97_g3535 [Lecanicillium saksenae]
MYHLTPVKIARRPLFQRKFDTPHGQARSLVQTDRTNRANDVFEYLFDDASLDNRFRHRPGVEMIWVRANVGSDGIVKADPTFANGQQTTASWLFVQR